jgi:hypothetical protein
MSQAENILLFDVVFSILLITFGAATGAASPNILQSLQTPKLAPNPSGQFANCQNTDAGCIASNLVLATAYIGWSFVNLPVLIIFFTQLFFIFGNNVLSVAFSPSFNPNGVPFLGIFFTGLQFYILWEVLRTIRGSSTGV